MDFSAYHVAGCVGACTWNEHSATCIVSELITLMMGRDVADEVDVAAAQDQLSIGGAAMHLSSTCSPPESAEPPGVGDGVLGKCGASGHHCDDLADWRAYLRLLLL